MKNKVLAIFGIGTYVLSILSSATDLDGNSVSPIFLTIISGIATALFIIMAIVRLWKEVKHLSIIFLLATSIHFTLAVIQEIYSPEYGNLIIILQNISKIIYVIAFIWVIVVLFRIKSDNLQKRGCEDEKNP